MLIVLGALLVSWAGIQAADACGCVLLFVLPPFFRPSQSLAPLPRPAVGGEAGYAKVVAILDKQGAAIDKQGAAIDKQGAELTKLRAAMETAEARDEKQRLARFIVQPGPASRGSPTASARSADEKARIELKVRTLEYYGLVESREGDDKKVWTARTMLHAPDAPPLPLEACTLAHIWPSELSRLASEIAAELHLPDNFYTEPRNYLVLPKDAHDGFDNHALIFLPGIGGNITVRKWRVEDRSVEEAAAVSKYFGMELTWPNKAVATPHLPFMRLLAWRMLTAIKKQPDDEPAISWGDEQNAALNASVGAEGNKAVRDLCDRLSLL